MTSCIRASVVEELDDYEAQGAAECRRAVAQLLDQHTALSGVLARLDEAEFAINWLR